MAIPHPHIVHKHSIAYVVNTSIPVCRLYQWHRRGVPTHILLARYPIIRLPAFLLDALSYGYDHQDEMDHSNAYLRDLLDPPSDIRYELASNLKLFP